MTPRAQEAFAAMAERPGWLIGIVGDVADNYPVGDLDVHVPGVRCACRPRVERGVTVLGARMRRVVFHRAWDGRDLVEDVEAGLKLGEML